MEGVNTVKPILVGCSIQLALKYCHHNYGLVPHDRFTGTRNLSMYSLQSASYMRCYHEMALLPYDLNNFSSDISGDGTSISNLFREEH